MPVNEITISTSVNADGFALIPPLFRDADTEQFVRALDDHTANHPAISRRGAGYAQRNILAIPAIRELAGSRELRDLIAPVLGPTAIPVRGILFDKVPQANWHVGWHQDCAIAVSEKRDTTELREMGFGPWSVKAGVAHVEPPTHVLENMLTLRVHLDDCDEHNGPMRVIAGSHRHGKLNVEDIRRCVAQREAVTCCLQRGGVLAMRPLLLHASSPAQHDAAPGGPPRPAHRRVVHIEYAGATTLPAALRWAVA